MTRATAPLLLAVVCLLAPAAAAAPAAEPLNVLLLYADDWRRDTLGRGNCIVLERDELHEVIAQAL